MKVEPFNDKADAWLSDLLDRVERKAVRNGRCAAEQADEYLTMRYIEDTSGLIEGAQQYMLMDEVLGAEIYLSKLGDPRLDRWQSKRQRLCALQLVGHTHNYFPNYHSILNSTVQHILQLPCGQRFNISHCGVLLLASATLAGARSRIRRELRRRGIELPLTLSSDQDMIEKLMAVEKYNGRIKRITNSRI